MERTGVQCDAQGIPVAFHRDALPAAAVDAERVEFPAALTPGELQFQNPGAGQNRRASRFDEGNPVGAQNHAGVGLFGHVQQDHPGAFGKFPPVDGAEGDAAVGRILPDPERAERFLRAAFHADRFGAGGENPELAAEWRAWAKCSEDGEKHIWNDLGFDVCNEALWSDEAFAYDESNQYNTFFRVKPYEVLNELAANDAIGTIYTTANSPALNEQINTYTLNEIFVDGADVADALQEAQDAIDSEIG